MSTKQTKGHSLTINFKPEGIQEYELEGSVGLNKQALLESELYDKPQKIDWKSEAALQKLTQNSELHVLRKNHSRRLFRLITCWLVADFFLVLLSGYGQWPFPIPAFCHLIALSFSLDSKVLIALLVTTTATVLGLYAIAAKWLFNGNSNYANDKNTTKVKSNKSIKTD